jgi:hypothetical protein
MTWQTGTTYKKLSDGYHDVHLRTPAGLLLERSDSISLA